MGIEIKRSVTSRYFKIALFIGVVIALFHVYEKVLPLYKYNSILREISTVKGLYYPEFLLENWMGGSTSSMESFLYYLILPILAVLPFGSSFDSERKQRVLSNILIRITKRKYICNKAIAVFISGGLVVTIPLLMNLCVTGVFLPNLPPQPAEGYLMQDIGFFSELYLRQPYAYFGLYLVVDFVFAGLLAVMALGVSFFSENKFIIILFPMLVHISCYSLLFMLSVTEYSPLYIFQSGYMLKSIYPMIIPLVVLVVINAVMLVIGVKNEEVY